MALSDEIVAVKELAALLLLSERRVQQLTKDNVIPRLERGKYDRTAATQGYIKYLQDHSTSSAANNLDLKAERARLTKEKADQAAIETAQMRSEVVSVKQVELNLSNLFAEITTNLRNVPGRVTTDRELKKRIQDEIDSVLTALADADVTIEASEDEAADDGGV